MPSPNVIAYTNESGTEVFSIDQSGNVTAAGTISTTGTDDFGSGGIKTDVIAESTAATGVTVDGAKILDGHILDSVGFYDAAAPTKIARIDAGAITAGQTRVIAMPDANVTLVADPASLATLALTTAGNGASLIGIEDSGTLITATNVETALAEIMGELNDYRDQVVQVDVQVTGGSGGSADGTLETTVTRAITGAVATACQVLLVATAAQYDPVLALVATVTFDTATKGSIAASGAGWALVTTDAAGEFDCAVHDSADETIYFRALTPQGGDAAGERCLVVHSNSDAATWAA